MKTFSHREWSARIAVAILGLLISTSCGRDGTPPTAPGLQGPLFSRNGTPRSLVMLTVTTAGDGAGMVAVSPAPLGSCGPGCYTYEADQTVTLTATANAGSMFTGWTGCTVGKDDGEHDNNSGNSSKDNNSGTSRNGGNNNGNNGNNDDQNKNNIGDGQGNKCHVKMTSAKTVTATFKQLFNLTVTKAGDATGTVTATPAVSSCGAGCYTYISGTSVTLTATALTGTFTGWSGDCTVVLANTCTVAMTAAKSVTATFSRLATTVSFNCPASVVYSGLAQTPCTATVTAPGLSQALTPTYSANVDVGTVTVGASYPGVGIYAAATGSTTFQITQAPTVTTVTCSVTTLVFTGSPLTPPCSVTVTSPTVTGPGALSLTPPPTYTLNLNIGTATASYIFAGSLNYQASTGSATFTITPAPTVTTVTCPASVAYTGLALSPCSATVSALLVISPAPGLTQTVTWTYVPNNVDVGTVNVSASQPAGGNYLGSSGSATFNILPTLTVKVDGPGSITSIDPPGLGLSCGANTTCTASTSAAYVTLRPAPTDTSTFSGWSGGPKACNTVDCTVFLGTADSVTATFVKKTTPPPGGDYMLTVKVDLGTGVGATVTSDVGGISCGSGVSLQVCSASFSSATPVTLTLSGSCNTVVWSDDTTVPPIDVPGVINLLGDWLPFTIQLTSLVKVKHLTVICR